MRSAKPFPTSLSPPVTDVHTFCPVLQTSLATCQVCLRPGTLSASQSAAFSTCGHACSTTQPDRYAQPSCPAPATTGFPVASVPALHAYVNATTAAPLQAASKDSPFTNESATQLYGPILSTPSLDFSYRMSDRPSSFRSLLGRPFRRAPLRRSFCHRSLA